MDEYSKMLDEAYSKIPQVISSKERFEIPQVKGHIEGTKTLITNFSQIVKTINRDQAHVLKYLQKELATPGIVLPNGTLQLGSKVSSANINQKIEEYVKAYVICEECGKPDSELIKKDDVWLLKCNACGATRPVRKLN
jgi:translation initiation factor 2 subunit 2